MMKKQLMMALLIAVMFGGIASAAPVATYQAAKSPAELHPDYFENDLCTKTIRAGKYTIVKNIVVQSEQDIHHIPKKDVANLKKKYCR